MANAKLNRESLTALGLKVFGGVNAPMSGLKTPAPNQLAVLRHLLNEAHVVGTPGQRFRRPGEGYFRISA